jgi:hypothetical protein
MIVDEAEFDLERWYAPSAREGRGLVFRAHRDPHDDAGRARTLAKYDFSSLPSWPASASR